MIPYPHNYSPELKCCWLKWTVESVDRLALRVPDFQCTDMTGAIEIGRRLMPNVTVIRVFNDDGLDTQYVLEGEPGEWRAVNGRMKG